MKKSIQWLQSIDVKAKSFGGRKSGDQFIRPLQGNASVYFNDPDGNSLELMCFIDVSESLQHITDKLSIEEWETLFNTYTMS